MPQPKPIALFFLKIILLQKSTIQLLRFKFSYFLMPVYWFALSFVQHINWGRAALVFCLLHFLLYPSSNGYNSYMDRDEGSIGGLASPMQPTKQLFMATVIMDAVAALLSLLISGWFALAMVVYIVFSRLYSYRGVRLKRFPILGYITVIVNQGTLVFWMVCHGSDADFAIVLPWQGLVAAGFLIGGFYPITQVYQHKADAKDGVTTISMLLGKRGTFVFCGIMYAIAFSVLFLYFNAQSRLWHFVILQIYFIPVIVTFMRWLIKVWKDENAADFRHTMLMNWLASTCTSLAFITLLILQQIG